MPPAAHTPLPAASRLTPPCSHLPGLVHMRLPHCTLLQPMRQTASVQNSQGDMNCTAQPVTYTVVWCTQADGIAAICSRNKYLSTAYLHRRGYMWDVWPLLPISAGLSASGSLPSSSGCVPSRHLGQFPAFAALFCRRLWHLHMLRAWHVPLLLISGPAASGLCHLACFAHSFLS